ncbi:uncharacterized protein DS421_9g269540 [Arachis hypogaea]|nr:uncharacterized protein DS421_9g269540 [Arachis hypogaea]
MELTKCNLPICNYLNECNCLVKINQFPISIYAQGLRTSKSNPQLNRVIKYFFTNLHENYDHGWKHVIEHQTLTGSVCTLFAQVFRVDSLNYLLIMLSKICFSSNNQQIFHACIQVS